MRSFPFAVLVLAASALSAGGAPQTFEVRREVSVVLDKTATTLPTPRAVTATGVQVPAAGQTPGAMRVHLRIAPTTVERGWTIEVADAQGQVIQRIGGSAELVKQGGLWTDEVANGPVRISLSAADPSGVAIVIDRFAAAMVPDIPQAIVGANQLMKITDAAVPARVKDWAPSIARLRFMVPEGEAVCSGFLVGADLLMTNQHCISTEEEARSALVEFGFDSEAAEPARFRVTGVEAADFGLDYSLLRLSARPPAAFGRLHFGDAPVAKRSLAIVQHPAGRAKEVSFFPDCSAGEPVVAGRTTPDSDFEHLCDTQGGSSGSPVLDWETGRVVGLHHLGFREGVDTLKNQAVHIAPILAHVRTRVSETVFAEITRQP